MAGQLPHDAILDAIGDDPEGQSVADLQQALRSELSLRTLQRRLSTLVAAGQLVQVGRSRAVRYRRVAPGTSAASVPARGDTSTVVLSPQGRQLQALVRRPRHTRTPVTYERTLLDGYEPNVTAYLPAATRKRLHAMGRSHATARPAGTYARDVLGRLLIDLSWASSNLEGNTYTRLDTQNLIELGQLAEGKARKEAQMILNHKAAIEMLVEDAATIGFNRYTIQNLHALLSENLLNDPSAVGRLRTIPVEISGTVFIPLAIPQRIEEHFDRLLACAEQIEDPFEQAFFAMVHLPYLQPFEDVNKRVSRLAANIPFIKQNLSPLSFVDVPEAAYIDGTLAVSELNRVELLRDVFVWAYARSCLRYVAVKDSIPEPDPLRLRNRQALIEIVGAVVREDAAVVLADLRERARPIVSADDLDQLAATAFQELHFLYEGNLARYRLRLSELARWRHRPTK